MLDKILTAAESDFYDVLNSIENDLSTNYIKHSKVIESNLKDFKRFSKLIKPLDDDESDLFEKVKSIQLPASPRIRHKRQTSNSSSCATLAQQLAAANMTITAIQTQISNTNATLSSANSTLSSLTTRAASASGFRKFFLNLMAGIQNRIANAIAAALKSQQANLAKLQNTLAAIQAKQLAAGCITTTTSSSSSSTSTTTTASTLPTTQSTSSTTPAVPRECGE